MLGENLFRLFCGLGTPATAIRSLHREAIGYTYRSELFVKQSFDNIGCIRPSA